MFQLFKPLTERQYTESDLRNHKMYERELVAEQRRISGMIDANKMMIQQLENELDMMK